MVYKKVYEVRGANKREETGEEERGNRRKMAIMLHTYANKC